MGRKIRKEKNRYRSTGGREGRDFNDRGPKNASSRTRGEGSDIKEPVKLFNLTPSPVASFFGEAKVISRLVVRLDPAKTGPRAGVGFRRCARLDPALRCKLASRAFPRPSLTTGWGVTFS